MKTRKIFYTVCKIFLASIVIALIINPALAFGIFVGGAKFAAVTPTLDTGDLDPNLEVDEERDMSKFIYEKTFNNPTLNDIHFIESGIKHDKQIVLMNRFGLFGKRHEGGNCAPPVSSNKLQPSQKKWEPKYVTDRLQECWDTLYDTFVKLQMKANSDKPDISTTAWIRFIEDMLANDSIPEMLLRVAHFSDENEDNVAPYGAGNITAGEDPDFFKAIKKGMWPQLFDIATANTERRIEIDKNAEATYDDQEFDDSDTSAKTVSKIFRDLIQKADPRLRKDSRAVILCTESLADQYENELEAEGVDASFTMIMDGIKTLKRKGVTIISINFWDRYIKTYFDDGTKYYLPHRAVFTTSDNIPIGVEETGSLGKFTTYYDPKDQDYTITFGFTMDMKVLQDYLVQVAF